MNCRKYVAPAIEIITMQTEGMIAGSATNGNITIGSGEGSMGAAEMSSFEVEEPASFELND